MKKIAFVIGSFHQEEMAIMRDAAYELAIEQGFAVTEELWVPGSMEKPLAIKKLLLKEEIEGIVVLGIIEKGETKHGMTMANAVIKAIIDLQLEFLKPVGVGILGPEITPTQIPSRLIPYAHAAVKALDQMLKII